MLLTTVLHSQKYICILKRERVKNEIKTNKITTEDDTTIQTSHKNQKQYYMIAILNWKNVCIMCSQA